MHLIAILLILAINPPEPRSDQLDIALASFTSHHGASLTLTSDAVIPNLLGTTQTFATGLDSPLDRIWIHSTADERMFDITLADSSIKDLRAADAHSRLILLRILWAARAGDVQLFRAVMQASGISIQTRAIMNEEQSVLGLYAAMSSGRLPVVSQPIDGQGLLSASIETARNTFTITIRPTLNLVLNGDVDLFKKKLLRDLDAPSEPGHIQLSAFHDVQDDGSAGQVELPDFGLYYSRWSFNRVDGALVLSASAFDTLAVQEAWLPEHAALWSTLLFPDSLAFNGILRSPDYQLVMSLAMESGHRSTYSSPRALEPMLSFGGIRLPSYYVVSSVKRIQRSVEVEGYLMVFDPVLQYQHIFRITDVLHGDSAETMVWTESRVHAVLVMRSEQIQELNSAYPTGGSSLPVFQLRIRP